MKIETTPHENHQVKITAEFEADVFEGFKRRAARKIAGKTKISGFRPGKAPYDIIVRYVGEGAINEEAIEILIDEQYAKVLEEAAIEPSGPGTLEEIISLEPPKLSFVVPLKPEVELGEYKNIRIPYTPGEANDDDVKEFITRIQRNYATAEPTNQPIQKGDLIYVQLSAFDKDKAEGENEIFSNRPIQLIVGDDSYPDKWPFQNFSLELIGLSEEGEKTLEHSYPQEDDDTELAGKNVEFKVNVQSVKNLKLPELDDDFAKSLGQFETYADLENSVREQIDADKKRQYEDSYFTDLLAKFAEQATVKYPTHMVDHEIEHMLESLQEDLKRDNLDFDTYLKILKTDKDKYIEDNVRPAAEKRVVNSLIIDKFSQDEKIELAKDDVENILHETQHMIQEQNAQSKNKKGKISERQANSIAYNAMTRLYNQRTLERMKDLASGELDKVQETETAAETEKPKASKKTKAAAKAETAEKTGAAEEAGTAETTEAPKTRKKKDAAPKAEEAPSE